MPLRWIEWKDIDENVNEKLLQTQCEIDNISIGGKRVTQDDNVKKLIEKSTTLRQQLKEIKEKAPNQVAKIISFYYDFDVFLAALSKRLKPNAISVWTVGNRKVAKQEIYMNSILTELAGEYNLSLLTNFTRKISKKRMPEMNAYGGDDKGLQGTMTREHILVFVKGGLDNGKTVDTI